MRHLFECCKREWDIEEWHKRKNNFNAPSFYFNSYAAEQGVQETQQSNSELYGRLKKLRDRICHTKDLPVFMVASSKTLDEMARYLPQSSDELRKITGFGDAKIKQYGTEFLEIIEEYMEANELTSRMSEKPAKTKKKSP